MTTPSERDAQLLAGEAPNSQGLDPESVGLDVGRSAVLGVVTPYVLAGGPTADVKGGTAAYLTFEWGVDELTDGANRENVEYVIFTDKSDGDHGRNYYSSDPKVVKEFQELKELIDLARKNGRQLDIAVNVRSPPDRLEGFSYATKPKGK
jgi:hypothetical protein